MRNGPGEVVSRRTPFAIRHWRFAVVFLMALGLRAGYGGVQLYRSTDRTALTFPDEQQYWTMARGLRQGGPLTDELGFCATRMPLYPGLLSIFAGWDGGVVTARVCQWVIGALAAVFACLLGNRVRGPDVGFAAGLLAAADPSLVGVSSLLLTETPFVAVVAALWWVGWPLASRAWHSQAVACAPTSGGVRPLQQSEPGMGRWLGVGALSALCVYVRPSSAGLVLAWTVFLLVRRRFTLRAWGGAGMVVGTVVVCLLPWALRNQRITGHLCWLTHRAGISLYDGVGPQATGASNLGAIKNMPAVAGLDEAAWNRWFLTESFRSIRSDPVRIIRLAGVKLARTWSPVLHAQEYRSTGARLVFAAWSIPFFALAVAGMVMLRRDAGTWLALLLPTLYLSALHSVFVGSVRYRTGALPMLAVFSAVALVGLPKLLRNRGGERC